MDRNMQVRRAVVALNNIGISLLSQRAFRQARATFNDAIALVRFSSQAPQASLTVSASFVHETLGRNEQRLARPQPSENVTEELHVYSLDLAAGHANQSPLMERNAPQTVPLTAIRVESSILELDPMPEMESAILMHNFGVACHFVALLLSDQLAIGKIQEGATRLFQISRSLLARDLVDSCARSESRCEHLIYLNLVSLHACTRSLVKNAREAEARPLHTTMMELQTTMQQHYSTNSKIGMLFSAAAAA